MIHEVDKKLDEWNGEKALRQDARSWHDEYARRLDEDDGGGLMLLLWIFGVPITIAAILHYQYGELTSILFGLLALISNAYITFKVLVPFKDKKVRREMVKDGWPSQPPPV